MAIKIYDLKEAVFLAHPMDNTQRINEPCNANFAIYEFFCNARSVTIFGVLIEPSPDPNELADHGVGIHVQGLRDLPNFRFVR